MLVAVIRKVGLIGTLSVILSSCTWQKPIQVTLSSGSSGSGYQRISQQISRSAESMGDVTVQDAYNSQGSRQNLERLLEKEVDFAIVQLDVASQAMKAGKVKTVLILTQEYLHLVTRRDSSITTFADLKGKRIAVGDPGSGIYFTSKRILAASNLNIVEVQSNQDLIAQLLHREIDAFVYVGPLGASEKVRQSLRKTDNLRFIPIEPYIANYLTIQFPESYRSAVIPQGTYKPLPQLPSEDLPTISTAGALITRPDVNAQKVAWLTWAIVSNVRQFAPFEREFASEGGEKLLYQGLTYVHEGAQSVFTQGDPRNAWLRYLRENKPLQAASIMLLITSSLGFSVRWWHRQRYQNLILANRQAIAELRELMERNPTKSLEEVEDLRQQYRLMLIDGAISAEAHEQIERVTQIFAEQCRQQQEKQRRASIDLVLNSINEWQETLDHNRQGNLNQVEIARQKYLEMLVARQIDLQTYLQLMQLTLSWPVRVKQEEAHLSPEGVSAHLGSG